MRRGSGALPNTASISGAAASRSGVTTSMSAGDSERSRGEQREQLIVQHLELARARMADVDFDAAVVVGERDAAAARDRRDRGSRPAASRAASAASPARTTRLRSTASSTAPASSSRQERLRLRAPRCEQPVAGLVMRGFAACRKPRQPLRVDDVEPVLAARIQDIDVDVGEAREAADDVEIERRHRRHAEDVRAHPGALPEVPRRSRSPRRIRATDGAAARPPPARSAATARPASAHAPRRRRRRRGRRDCPTIPRATSAGT